MTKIADPGALAFVAVEAFLLTLWLRAAAARRAESCPSPWLVLVERVTFGVAFGIAWGCTALYVGGDWISFTAGAAAFVVPSWARDVWHDVADARARRDFAKTVDRTIHDYRTHERSNHG